MTRPPQSSSSSSCTGSGRLRFWLLSLTGGCMRSCWTSSRGSIFCASENDVLLSVVLRVLVRVSNLDEHICTKLYSRLDVTIPLHKCDDVALFNHPPSAVLCIGCEINADLLEKVVGCMDKGVKSVLAEVSFASL